MTDKVVSHGLLVKDREETAQTFAASPQLTYSTAQGRSGADSDSYARANSKNSSQRFASPTDGKTVNARLHQEPTLLNYSPTPAAA